MNGGNQENVKSGNQAVNFSPVEFRRHDQTKMHLG